MPITTRALPVIATAICAIALLPASASAASCKPVKNPYPGTEFDDVDLTHIRAKGVGCEKAREVARKAHRKALALPLPPDGIRRLRWHGWKVRGDLRPSIDRYRATKSGAKVRWRF